MQSVSLCQPMISIGFDKFFVVEKSFVFSMVSKLSKCRQLGGDHIRHGKKQVRRNDTKIDQRALF